MLVCDGITGVPFDGEQLPPNLQDLTWRDAFFAGGAGSREDSLQPLLALSQLRKLRLRMCDNAPEAEQVAQLTACSSLTDLVFNFSWSGVSEQLHRAEGAAVAAAEEEAAAAASEVWQLLPLKGLSWDSRCIPDDVLQQLSSLQGLTRSELQLTGARDPQQQLQTAEVAAVLKPLTKLQQLQLFLNPRFDHAQRTRAWASEEHDFNSSNRTDDAQGVTAFLHVVAGMCDLGQLNVNLPVHLSEAEAQQLSGMLHAQQLLPGCLGQCCSVTVTT
jgi:hypothetical protein